MKRITKYLTLLLTGTLAALTACGPEMDEVEAHHVPSVNGTTLAPLSDESGSIRAYVGTEVSVEGFNLDLVSHVSVGDLDAEITEQTIKTLKFKVPALDLAQQDTPYQVWIDIYDADGERVIFHYPYYVTVPVTDALISGYAPSEGTVGTEVTLSGRNLEQITRVHFGEQTVEAADFTEVTSDAVKFAVPAGEYATGDSRLAISAEWGTETIDVTGETLFTLHTPDFDAVSQPDGANSVIGDEVTFTGRNLDLVSGMKWGDCDLIVMSVEAGAVTVKFPSSIAQSDPVVAEAALTALWGTPEQTTPVASAWRLDTTPVGPAEPVVLKMEAEDGGADNRFYLGKTVTVTGENLASIESFRVDGVEAVLAGEPTDVEAKFLVPEGVTFAEVTEVSVTALYNGGNEVDCGRATVCPFYYWKDVELGSGSSSVNAYPYPDFAREHAFFLPDLGTVISADTWVAESSDPFALVSPNVAVSAASTLNKSNITADQYYDIRPYLFLTTGSDGKLAWQNPAGSASQLKCHRTADKESVASTYGTPIILYSVQKNGEVYDAVKNGTIASMTLFDSKAGSSAPAFGTARDWTVGDVIVVQYVTYTKGSKPSALADVRRQGFIHVTEVTCGDPDKGTATDLNGHVKFDFYWSKVLNE